LIAGNPKQKTQAEVYIEGGAKIGERLGCRDRRRKVFGGGPTRLTNFPLKRQEKTKQLEGEKRNIS